MDTDRTGKPATGTGDDALGFSIIDEVRELMGQHGRVGDYISAYRIRKTQMEMAERVAGVFADPGGSSDLVIEAATGIGKTLAYALPALMSGRRVLISTATRYLQDQLFSRDLNLVINVLGRDCHIALLKGRASYVCLERMEKAQPVDKQQIHQLKEVRQWALRSPHGDLDKYDQSEIDRQLLPQITSTTENCTARRCPKYNDCFVYRARRQAMKAKVVVTNHNLLLHDLQMRAQGWSELLPQVDVCIFDEAHKLLGTASEVYSTEISIQALARQLIEICKAAASEDDDHNRITTEAAQECANLLLQLHTTLVQHSLTGASFVQEDVAGGASAGNEADGGDLSLFEEGRHDADTLKEDFALDEALEDPGVCHAFERVIESLQKLADHLDSSESAHEGIVSFSSHKLRQSIGEIAGILAAANKERLDVISYYRIGATTTQLCMIPFDLSEIYSSQIGELCKVGIYTSATLCANGSFDYFTGQLGLTGAQTLCCESDFNYAEHSLLWLPARGAPIPGSRAQRGAGDSERYQNERHRHIAHFVETIAPVLREINGRSMILLTSRMALRIAEQCLSAARLGLSLLVQGDQSSTVLMNRFLSEQPAVLLGMATFWEGVDIRGSQLVFVAIDKLPFESPYTPVNIKRQQFMTSREQEFFKDYLLPRAILRLKQGAGRLIRDHSDYGILTIADPRLLHRSYGRSFLASLPPFRHTRDAQEVMEFAATRCACPQPPASD